MSRRLPFFLLSAVVFLAMTPAVSFAQAQGQLIYLGLRGRMLVRSLRALWVNSIRWPWRAGLRVVGFGVARILSVDGRVPDEFAAHTVLSLGFDGLLAFRRILVKPLEG